MNRIKRLATAVFTAAALLLFGLPVYADAVAPGPVEMLMSRIEDCLPALLITIGVLGIATAVILIVVFRVRKKKRAEQEKKN